MATVDPKGMEGRSPNGRFTKGNKWSTMKGIFQTPAEMEAAITEYFTEVLKPFGRNREFRPTINGLCFHLGFSTRQTLHDYEKKDDDYGHLVKRAKLYILSCYEEKLYSKDWGGAAFALKNIGKGEWTDEVIQQQHQTITEVTITEKQREE